MRLIALSLLALVGCRSAVGEAYSEAMARNLENDEEAAPREETLVVRDPDTKIVRESRRFISEDGVIARNVGEQRTWYDNGQPETRRMFVGGDPAGVWWSWWRNGALRSSYVFDATKPTRMTWWHPNGLLASDGLARNGARTGPWKFWHENGELESEGEFRGGKRHGPWTFYDEDGEWTERGTYSAGSRVGAWERADRL